MKQQKVKLVKQMRDEAEQVRVWKQKKEREVIKLKQNERKQQFQVQSSSNVFFFFTLFLSWYVHNEVCNVFYPLIEIFLFILTDYSNGNSSHEAEECASTQDGGGHGVKQEVARRLGEAEERQENLEGRHRQQGWSCRRCRKDEKRCHAGFAFVIFFTSYQFLIFFLNSKFLDVQ